MPWRRGEAGYFVVVDPMGVEIAASRRAVPAGVNHSGDDAVVDQLLRTKGEGCEVVFKAGPVPAKRQRLGVRFKGEGTS